MGILKYYEQPMMSIPDWSDDQVIDVKKYIYKCECICKEDWSSVDAKQKLTNTYSSPRGQLPLANL